MSGLLAGPRRLHGRLASRVGPAVGYCALLSFALLALALVLKAYRTSLSSCDEPAWLQLAPFLVTVAIGWTWVWVFPPAALASALLRWRRRCRGASPAPHRSRARATLLLVLALPPALALHHYLFWPVFTVDDGPFYAERFDGSVAALPLHSRIRLRRFGTAPLFLEVRTAPGSPATNVFVLRDDADRVVWARRPLCQEGLGPIRLDERHTRVAWWGGWEVAIRPARQEAGRLYLGPLGGYRYFYHSW